MSLIIHPELACFSDLKTAAPAKVVEALADGRSLKAFSSLKIGVVNLMPTKEATERHWSKLFMASSHWIEPVWIHMESYQSKNTDQTYLEKFYLEASKVAWQEIDGLIITGAPVEHMAFESVDYWLELCALIDQATDAHVPILAVCWGAQALLYKRYGIQKQSLDKKCFGLFRHWVSQSHPMTRAVPEVVYLPHSRHTGWDKNRLDWHPELEVVIASEEAGVFALEDAEGDWYWSGHVEYETDTLLQEYERDISKGIKQAPPEGYTFERGVWTPNQKWQKTGTELLGNWIDALAPHSSSFVVSK